MARWLLCCAFLTGTAAAQPPTAAPLKTLRVSFPAAETGFDPVQIGDTYSYAITSHIFESLYRYDHLARPVKIRPLVELRRRALDGKRPFEYDRPIEGLRALDRHTLQISRHRGQGLGNCQWHLEMAHERPVWRCVARDATKLQDVSDGRCPTSAAQQTAAVGRRVADTGHPGTNDSGRSVSDSLNAGCGHRPATYCCRWSH